MLADEIGHSGGGCLGEAALHVAHAAVEVANTDIRGRQGRNLAWLSDMWRMGSTAKGGEHIEEGSYSRLIHFCITKL